MRNNETATADKYQQFCGKLNRFDLSTPFVRDGKLICTDGFVLICTPTDEPATTGRKLPQSLPDISENGEWVDGPPLLDLSKKCNEACEYCDGGKTTECDCETCDGTGYITCHACGNEEDCDDCDGTGTVDGGPVRDCEECNGTGLTEAAMSYRRVVPVIATSIKHHIGKHLTKFILDDGALGVIAIGSENIHEEQ